MLHNINRPLLHFSGAKVQLDGTKWPLLTLSERMILITFANAFLNPPGIDSINMSSRKASESIGKKMQSFYQEIIKIAFDQIFNKAMRKPSVAWQQIRDAINEAFEIIFKNFVKSANDYCQTYNDSYDSLKFVPPEYEQFLVVGDTTVNWKSIADIASLSERIANWKEIEIKKDSDEFNLLCYTVADSLKRHDYNKELF